VLGVRPALEHPNVTLLTGAKVTRLGTDQAGTSVTEVVVDCDGSEERFTADVVVVSCGAANSAKLLLQSANDRHPNGLANGSDQVGRNYMFHDSTAVLALSREENETAYQKTLGLNDFYFGADDFEYPLGNVQMVGKSQAAMFRGERPSGRSSAWLSTRSTSGSRRRTCRGLTTASRWIARGTSRSRTRRRTRRRRSSSTRR
jgi:choline dehydrogenase-like flavoprotein